MTAEEMALSKMGRRSTSFAESPAGKAHLAAVEADLVRRGAEHGLSARQVAAADRLGMGLRKFALYAGARTVHDATRIDKLLRAEADAQAEAERQAAVARAKATMR